MAATEGECFQVVRLIRQRYPKLVCDVWERYDRAGEFYISVISWDYEMPELNEILPTGWKATDWVNADQRAMTCSVNRGNWP